MALVEVNNLAVQFGGIRAVDGVTFRISPGEIYTIIGPNGAGKTTIFNLISRIYDPTEGTLEFNGRDITREEPHRIAQLGIARTFQNIELFEKYHRARQPVARPPQASPDGDFPNVPGHVSNPENAVVFDALIKRAKQIGGDLALATDPDCDRIGIQFQRQR